MIVYRGLACALRCESADAIAAAWDVTVAPVKGWQATGIKKPPWHVYNGSNRGDILPILDELLVDLEEAVQKKKGKAVAGKKRNCPADTEPAGPAG